MMEYEVNIKIMFASAQFFLKRQKLYSKSDQNCAHTGMHAHPMQYYE